MQDNNHANGSAAAVSVDRAMVELRQGRPVSLYQDERTLFCVALETVLTPPDGFRAADRTLVIAAERAKTLGLEAVVTALRPPPEIDFESLRLLALASDDGGQAVAGYPAAVADPAQQAALILAKHARLLPTLLTWREAPDAQPADAQSSGAGPVAVDISAVVDYPQSRAGQLIRVSDARVPLRAGVDSRFVLFRSSDGASEHLAVIVGKPDFSRPVLVRLHSSCITGDLFGSLRCDCGEQLQRALVALAAEGGVLLYLAQEGRNIGLANKLRAYTLQDTGLDTIAADAQLGFSPDERYYDIGAAVLRELGIDRIRLLTNNPTKLVALAAHGIEISERVALTGTANPHNQGYLDTKKRAGHLL